MKTNTLLIKAALLVLAAASALTAQTPQPHVISTASAVSSEPFRAVGSVRELPNGHVLVNDILSRRVLLMDSSMHVERVVLDSASSNGGDSYGVRPGALVPYRADTTLFVDPAAFSMLVIDGQGNIVRARSVWRAQDANSVAAPGAAIGQIGPDARGRIVYRVVPQPAFGMARPNSGVTSFPAMPDTAFVVAADPDTRKIDTLGVVRIPSMNMHMVQSEGRVSITPVINPLPQADEWAVLADGTVAFVRGRDYRVDYLHADGTITSSPKLPFDWQRLSDEDKQRLVDSTMTAQQKQAMNEYATSMIRWVNQYGKEYPKDFTIPEGFTPTPGLPKDVVLPAGVKLPENYMYACPAGADQPAMPSFTPPPQHDGAGVVTNVVVSRAPQSSDGMTSSSNCVPAPMMFSSNGQMPAPRMRSVEVVPATQLPDYRPPFPAGAVRADREGNLWIRTYPMKPIPGGPVFDIVSSKGELVDRVQLPQGYAIVGFGRNKVVYLSSRDAAGIHIARVRLK